jgi:hypothetical protein
MRRFARWLRSGRRSVGSGIAISVVFARRWPHAEWAIEGAAGLGTPLTARLPDDGVIAIDVPAKLAARVRMLSTGHARKSDEADAVSVGIASLNAPARHRADVDEAISALRGGSSIATIWPSSGSDHQPAPRAADSTDPGRCADTSQCRYCGRAAATRPPA